MDDVNSSLSACIGFSGWSRAMLSNTGSPISNFTSTFRTTLMPRSSRNPPQPQSRSSSESRQIFLESCLTTCSVHTLTTHLWE
ncbi:hypothetical protein CY34DRAFT_803538 [Suillus luteus UH-Slu-Lm8-n1]|uniref:Uncharacterized protein n=1 Tax=Suillus luteus UH-Slu-Lm8-n1 TaxID=930992 RepID=A0A0D0BBP4_9AGAM|nr:hypothetical protein CY34DRAFT_803538 [Suillus luteus UH-Slu-Lm8-n1]